MDCYLNYVEFSLQGDVCGHILSLLDILASNSSFVFYLNSWINHGRPPGANVAAIADVGTVKPNILFTVR